VTNHTAILKRDRFPANCRVIGHIFEKEDWAMLRFKLVLDVCRSRWSGGSSSRGKRMALSRVFL
jgi:hypothetical protein